MEHLDNLLNKLIEHIEKQRGPTDFKKIITSGTSCRHVNCEICDDTGMVINENTGKPTICPHCKIGDELREREIDIRYDNFNLGKHYWDYRLEDFDEKLKGKRSAIMLAKAFAEKSSEPYSEKVINKLYQQLGIEKRFNNEQMPGSLLIYGDVGTGKTAILAAVANHMINSSNIYVDKLYGAFQALQDTFDNDTSTSKVLDRIMKVEILFLDEFPDTENLTDWKRNIIYRIIDYRYQNQLPTMITSNYSSDQLHGILGDAIASRLRNMCYIVKMSGKVYRVHRREFPHE